MDRLEKQIAFIKEIDKAKFIKRQTYLSDGDTFEDDSQHSWHLALMTILLNEYSNKEIDVLKTVTMVLIHDLVEIYAGDTYAYDEEAKKTQKDREIAGANKIFSLLPNDQKDYLLDLWYEFEEGITNEAKFAHTMDNFQPTMLNALTDGKAWKERNININQILERNKYTSQGSEKLWQYDLKNFIEPNVKKGRIKK